MIARPENASIMAKSRPMGEVYTSPAPRFNTEGLKPQA